MSNIYTIGFSSLYDRWMVEQGNDFKKKGVTQDYAGGVAFIGFKNAMIALKEIKTPGYKLYMLDTDEKNLYLNNGKYHIRKSCRILPCKW